MIYTTYFAKLGTLPSDIVPISIARRTPIGWRGKTYKRLAPSWPILQRYKATGDETEYRVRYERDVLGWQDPELCYIYLHEVLAEGKDFALVCYERPEKFCHRHLVADWFTKNGYEVREWGEVEEKSMSEEIFDCVYNWWTGFEGKETCEAGYMVCKEKECPAYCRGTLKWEENSEND